MNKLYLIYLTIAIVIWLAGYFHTGRFVRPKWKIPGKFIFYIGVSYALVHFLDYWALLFIILHPLLGFVFHYKVCKSHDIDWLTCEPRDKYLELQEKWAKGDFGNTSV